MATQKPSLVHIYARNVEHFAFKRGWQPPKLAHELGITLNTLNRIRFSRSRYLDPEVFVAMLELFE